MNYLYIYVKKGTPFKVGEEVCEKQRLAIRADYVTLPNGDAVGKVITTNGMTRQVLEAVNGITVLPPAHRPLQAQHITTFGQANLKTPLVQGDTAYECGEKLYQTHGVEWMHPENWFLGGGAALADTADSREPDGGNPKGPADIPQTPNPMYANGAATKVP